MLYVKHIMSKSIKPMKINGKEIKDWQERHYKIIERSEQMFRINTQGKKINI